MPDVTDEFVHNPVEFLRQNIVLMAVPPDPLGVQTTTFQVTTENHVEAGKRICQIEVGHGAVWAYWVDYLADGAGTLALGGAHNFVLSHGLTGCTIGVHEAGGIYTVRHSNAQTLGFHFTGFLGGSGRSPQEIRDIGALFQKGIQQAMTQSLGPGTRIGTSEGSNASTFVGIRNVAAWSFYIQENTVGNMGDVIASVLRSLSQ